MINDVWCVPLDPETALIYAPFHGISTLVNRTMAELILCCLHDPVEPVLEEAAWITSLREPGLRPLRHHGTADPLFLGLIPTRGCMMQCAYCDFVTLKNHPVMSFARIRETIDGYAELLRGKANAVWNMHFFGGEPFAAFKEVVFAVNYARRKAAELEIPTHFEVTTNGCYPAEKCRWIAENFDTVVLSLDGFPESQNLHRPGPKGTDSFPIVCRSADILSRGSCELIIRSCVSADNADKLPEWAAFLAERWAPEAVCLEPMIESGLAEQNGLHSPDPFIFAQRWASAQRILKSERIRLVYSSADISEAKNSLCPMGRDALIIDPEGRIADCWQLSENQHAGGVDLCFGSVSGSGLDIDKDLLEQQRDLSESNRERCRGCFCYAHCAGGCVLNKERGGVFCRLTRTVTLWLLLERLGYGIRADGLLKNKDFLDRLAEIPDFRLGEISFSDIPDILTDPAHGFDAPDLARDPGSISLPPLPSDPPRGWIRDGSRILTVDIEKVFVKVLEGKDALRFQLENSGMNAAEITAVWDALFEEAD